MKEIICSLSFFFIIQRIICEDGGLESHSICGCSHGSPKVGNKCLYHNDVECEKCDAGFHLEKDICVSDKERTLEILHNCKCDNGIAMEASFCEADGMVYCDSCDASYYLHEKKCHRNCRLIFKLK